MTTATTATTDPFALAQEAAERAKALGWKTWANFDQSTFQPYMATVVAQHPITGLYRVGRWIEGHLAYVEWVESRIEALDRLRYFDAYDCQGRLKIIQAPLSAISTPPSASIPSGLPQSPDLTSRNGLPGAGLPGSR